MRVDKQLASSHELVIELSYVGVWQLKSPQTIETSQENTKKIEFVVGKDLSQNNSFLPPQLQAL